MKIKKRQHKTLGFFIRIALVEVEMNVQAAAHAKRPNLVEVQVDKYRNLLKW